MLLLYRVNRVRALGRMFFSVGLAEQDKAREDNQRGLIYSVR